MIRQRMPYWMYSLEELRCDLTAFGEAVQLEGEGFAFARHVQYAILFDRLFRFPVTGTRVRNYDGLGGQLLFAYLHKHGYVHWTDNQLTIEWDRLADGVAACAPRSRRSTARASTAPSSRTGRPRTTSSPPTSRRRRTAWAQEVARAERPGTRAATSTRSARRVPAVDVLHVAEGEAGRAVELAGRRGVSRSPSPAPAAPSAARSSTAASRRAQVSAPRSAEVDLLDARATQAWADSLERRRRARAPRRRLARRRRPGGHRMAARAARHDAAERHARLPGAAQAPPTGAS